MGSSDTSDSRNEKQGRDRAQDSYFCRLWQPLRQLTAVRLFSMLHSVEP